MKKIPIYLLLFFATTIGAQKNLSVEQWQKDLRFLQNTALKEYPFLFKKTTPEKFNLEANTLYNKIPSMEEHEIIVGLGRLVSSFKYGHTFVGFRNLPNFHHLPLNMYHFNDGVYIQGVHKNYKEVLGAKVIGIGDFTIEEALQKIYPAVPSENEQFFKSFGMLYLSSLETLHAQGIIKKLSDTIELTLEKEGKKFKQNFKALPNNNRAPLKYNLVQQKGDWLEAREQSNTPNYLKHFDKIYYDEYLPNHKTVYVRHSQIQDDPSESISNFYKRVFDFIDKNEVEKLVIDLRLNGGGNNFKNKSVLTEIIKSEKINKVGNLFVIIGRRTFSASQNLVNEMSNYTNAIFVGEPTGENINFYGDTKHVVLPNSKIPVYMSFAWWQDKPQWENAEWFTPHVPVDMSFEEYKTNKDPVLDAALNFSDENYILDPMQYMSELFTTGQIAKLRVDVAKMINDPNYKFFDFESKLNAVGSNLLGSGQTKNAVFVFQMVSGLFPNSSKSLNNLADSYLKIANKEEALKSYNKVIQLNLDEDAVKYATEKVKTLSKK